MHRVILSTVLLYALVCHATLRRVPELYSTITAATVAAVDGDTILLARGTYYERIRVVQKSLTITSNWIFSHDRIDKDSTFIYLPDSLLTSNDSALSVLRASNCQSFSVIGLCFRNGRGTYMPHSSSLRAGGGLLFDSTNAIVDYCKIEYCTALPGNGGGLYAVSRSFKLSNTSVDTCVIGGMYTSGGGVKILADSIEITSNQITRNHNLGYMGGGLVAVANLTGTFTNNFIANNASNRSGGGGGVQGFSQINHNIFYNNSASCDAAFLILNRSSNNTDTVRTEFISNTITNNVCCVVHGEPPLEGAGVFVQANRVAFYTIRNNVFRQNRAYTTGPAPVPVGALSLQSGHYTITNNRFELNDALRGAAISYRANAELFLDSNRFTGNQGLNAIYGIIGSLTATNNDFSGHPRNTIGRTTVIDNPMNFINNFWGDSTGPRCASNPLGRGDSIPDSIPYRPFRTTPVFPNTHTPEPGLRGENIPTSPSLLRCTPNPFNATTTIKYNVSKSAKIELAVFDITGREVGKLVNFEQNPGEYSVNFDGTTLATGTYFVRLKAGNFVQTRKMVLLK